MVTGHWLKPLRGKTLAASSSLPVAVCVACLMRTFAGSAAIATISLLVDSAGWQADKFHAYSRGFCTLRTSFRVVVIDKSCVSEQKICWYTEHGVVLVVVSEEMLPEGVTW